MSDPNHPPLRSVFIYTLDDLRLAKLRKKFNFRSNAKVIKLLLDSFEGNGGK